MASFERFIPGVLRPKPIVRSDVARPSSLDLPGLPARWSCDLSNDSLTWDGGVFDLFGIARGERLDRRAVVEMYAGHSRRELDHLRAAAIAARGSFTFEAEIVRADGATRWMRVVADTVVSNGRVTHLYGTKCDITREVLGSV